jgi:hypothetical protein
MAARNDGWLSPNCVVARLMEDVRHIAEAAAARGAKLSRKKAGDEENACSVLRYMNGHGSLGFSFPVSGLRGLGQWIASR